MYDRQHVRPFGNLSGNNSAMPDCLITRGYKLATLTSSNAGGLQHLTSLTLRNRFLPTNTLFKWSLVTIAYGGR